MTSVVSGWSAGRYVYCKNASSPSRGWRKRRTPRLRIEFAAWITCMRTPAANVEAIRALQNAAPTEVVEHFAIEADGSFLLDTMLVEAVAD